MPLGAAAVVAGAADGKDVVDMIGVCRIFVIEKERVASGTPRLNVSTVPYHADVNTLNPIILSSAEKVII